MKKIFSFLLFTFYFHAFADSADRQLLIDRYLAGKISKTEFLESAKNMRGLRHVKDVDIITQNGKKTLQWHIEVNSQTATTKAQRPSYQTLIQKISLYGEHKISKQELLSFINQISFPYKVVDLNKEGKSIRWVINSGNKIQPQKRGRKIASVPKTEAKKEINPQKLVPGPLALNMSFGQVSIDKQENTLSMNFLKLGGSYKYKAGKYTLTGSLNVSMLSNMKYTESNEQLNPSFYYLEGGITLAKPEKHFSNAIGYDYMNYFVLKDGENEVEVLPTGVHRISYKPSYAFNDSWSAFGSLGYVKNAGTTTIQGIDTGLGIGYRFGKNHNYGISGSIYQSNLEVDSETNQSQAFSANLNWGF